MFGVAVEWSPFLSIIWASAWGFIADTLSGKFWGFHVGAYVVAICLVNITAERFELHNPLYQMLFVGACAFGQSVALGLFLIVRSAGADGDGIQLCSISGAVAHDDVGADHHLPGLEHQGNNL